MKKTDTKDYIQPVWFHLYEILEKQNYNNRKYVSDCLQPTSKRGNLLERGIKILLRVLELCLESDNSYVTVNKHRNSSHCIYNGWIFLCANHTSIKLEKIKTKVKINWDIFEENQLNLAYFLLIFGYSDAYSVAIIIECMWIYVLDKIFMYKFYIFLQSSWS